MSKPIILSRLRAQREALGETRTTTRDVPGYNGDLAVRYKWVPYEELARSGRKLQKTKDPTKVEIYAAAATLAETCDEILIRVDGKLISLSEDGVPIHFGDERLAEALGFSWKGEARKAVISTFRNDYAMISEAMAISAWLQGADADGDALDEGSVDEEYAGN